MNYQHCWIVASGSVIAVALSVGHVSGQQPARAERDVAERERGERQPVGERDPQPERPSRPEVPGRPRPPGPDPLRGDGRGEDWSPIRPPGGLPGSLPSGRLPPGGPPVMPRDARPPRDGAPNLPFPPGRHLEELKKYDPEMYDLEVRDQELESQTQALAQQYRRSPQEGRGELKEQLQKLVEEHFEVRQARRELQLKRLESELQQMRASLAKRQEVRDQIIGRRTADLTGEQHDFDF